MLITFEGIEGAGKSTVIAALASDLRERGIPVLATREPGGTRLGDTLRSVFIDPLTNIDPLAEVMLVNASRAQLVAEVIAPALKAGQVVLCDRFFDATLAYQGYGRGLDVELLAEVCLIATQRIAPDMTILLDIPPEVSFERLRARGTGDRLEREDAEFHARVRDGYLDLARVFSRINVIDGTASASDVLAAVRAVIEPRLEALRTS
jgi:dTMP kinase